MEKPYTYYTVYKYMVDFRAPVEQIWAEAQAHDVGISVVGDRYRFTLSERHCGTYITQFLLRWGEYIVDSEEEVWLG